MMNNKNQGRGQMQPGIAPPLKSREQIRGEFVASIRDLRNAIKRATWGSQEADQFLDRLMEQGLQGMALCYAMGFREGRGEQ